MAVLAPYVFWQEFDNNGEPLAGGKVYTYEAGTTTNKRTFTDADETAENANPVILDSAGRADIWLDEGSYKFVIKDSNDVTIKTVDKFAGNAAGAIVSYDVSANLNLTSTYDNANIYTTGTFNINLLPAATASDGFQFRVYNEGSGTITIDPNSSETINGASTITIPASCWAFIYCTGTEWFAFVVNTMALQSASSVDINGGAIDAVTLGTNSPVTEAQIDNININGNSITSTNTDGDINITPNGTGQTIISNIPDPSSAQDPASKNYVDGLKATQANMEAEAANVVYADVAKYHRGIAKAWANLDGDGAPPATREDYNVSSITDTANGRWTFNLGVTMGSATYSVSICGSEDASGSGNNAVGYDDAITQTTTAFGVFNQASGGADQDISRVMIQVFGDLA